MALPRIKYFHAILVDYWQMADNGCKTMIDINGDIWCFDYPGPSNNYIHDLIRRKNIFTYNNNTKKVKYKNKFMTYYTYGEENKNNLNKETYTSIHGTTMTFDEVWNICCYNYYAPIKPKDYHSHVTLETENILLSCLLGD